METIDNIKKENEELKEKLMLLEKENEEFEAMYFTPFLISNAHFYKLLFFYKNYLKMYYYIVLVKWNTKTK